MTEPWWDLKYSLRKGDPDPNSWNAHVESFIFLFFAKRKARKLMNTKNRFVIVWDSEVDE
jgi:hypothetical protein